MKNQSTAVVDATVGSVVGKELNDPEEGAPSLPIVVYKVKVNRVAADSVGKLSEGGQIDVVYFDSDAASIEGASPIKVGQHLVMFLRLYPKGAPGISLVDSYYAPVGQDQGIFDVAGSKATARSEIVRSIDGESDAQYEEGRLVTTLDALLSAPSVPLK